MNKIFLIGQVSGEPSKCITPWGVEGMRVSLITQNPGQCEGIEQHILFSSDESNLEILRDVRCFDGIDVVGSLHFAYGWHFGRSFVRAYVAINSIQKVKNET